MNDLLVFLGALSTSVPRVQPSKSLFTSGCPHVRDLRDACYHYICHGIGGYWLVAPLAALQRSIRPNERLGLLWPSSSDWLALI